jgi:D-glycero-D-manno-heptose 1,7-bisphosphate phosphatase
MSKAIFFDRDGTIIKDHGYLKHEKDVEFYESTFESLKKLQQYFLLFIISNQPGIAKGLLTVKEVDAVNKFVLEQLQAQGILIQEFYYCPHNTGDNCICRKPNPYFVEQSVQKYSIDTNTSYVIGDHPSDMQLAFNVHANGMYLLTGHGRKHRQDLRNETSNKITICKNMKSAANLILKLNNHGS